MSQPLDYDTTPRPQTGRRDIAYFVPMAIFLLFTFLGGSYKSFYPLSYVLKTGIVAIALYCFWNYYTKIRWTHLGWGVAFGIIGTVQWIGMEKLLMSNDALSWTRMTKDIQGEAFRPHEFFKAAPALMWGFIAIRWAGASLLVPVMEELFWRDFAWRSIASPNNFELQKVGEYDRNAFWVVPLLFASVHQQWLTAIVWGLLIALLLVKTRSLGACIVMHGVTNFLLGAYVLYSHYVRHVDEWYFW